MYNSRLSNVNGALKTTSLGTTAVLQEHPETTREAEASHHKNPLKKIILRHKKILEMYL